MLTYLECDKIESDFLPPEQSTSEEEPRPEPPKKRGPGRPRKPGKL